MFNVFLSSVLFGLLSQNPPHQPSLSGTHVWFLGAAAHQPPGGGKCLGGILTCCFAADSFRIITSPLPWDFLISRSLNVNLALPGRGATVPSFSLHLPHFFFFFKLLLADLTAVVLNSLPGYFPGIHLPWLLGVRGCCGGNQKNGTARSLIKERKHTWWRAEMCIFIGVRSASIYRPCNYFTNQRKKIRFLCFILLRKHLSTPAKHTIIACVRLKPTCPLLHLPLER